MSALTIGRRTTINSVRGIGTLLATVAGLVVIAIGFGVWAASPHSSDLKSELAAALIAGRPEFSRYATLVAVSATTRGADSLNTCCYTAEFSFHQNGSTTVIPARADFRLYEGKWHLGDFWWGEPPHVNSVHVGVGIACGESLKGHGYFLVTPFTLPSSIRASVAGDGALR